ncbi:CaiB/BaiF CoA transferase family protein [Rhodococcus opacus]|uniref:CaiB/BaiF CoA transferase family protein n=1 Tax=Rhodococcus opacus TaxID=37919 RepID=UPI002954CD75|nr:CoA transferase [Rhodococcus opacus]MDV7089121.1 CoA transferase [Rhodococcus opacus]
MSTRPLDGYRIIDLTANVAGPLACQVMADLGAEVIKVEPPTGEAARRITATAPGAEHVTPYFSPNNRGKSSVRIDLTLPEGVASLMRLIETSDVVVQGMRPGTLERKGLGPKQVAKLNPRCIYTSLSAYGGGSPLEDRAGIDMMVQAEAGCLSAQPTGAPRLIPFQLVDSATGHVVAQAVLAALLHRERFGVVNHVAVSMYDVACSLQSNYLTLQMNLSATGVREAPTGSRPVAVEPSGAFPTAAGDIVLAAYVPAHWAVFVQVIGRPELAQDPRFVDQAARSVHSTELRAVLFDVLSTRSADEWVAILDAAGLMAARVNMWPDVVASEIFARRNLSIHAVQDGVEVDVIRTPARFSAFDTTQHTTIPSLGGDDSLLAGIAEQNDSPA